MKARDHQESIMRIRFFLAIVALLASTGINAKQSKNIGKIKPATEAPIDPVAARKAIEAANQDFIVALKKHDAKAIADAFEPDAVLLPPGADALHGRDEISKFFTSFVATATIDETSSVTLDVSLAANTAYEIGLYTMTTRTGNSAALADHGKYLCVWKHDSDGRWRVAREISNTSIAQAKSSPH
jgi:uncharacterized protein (TIGR02246 family)